MFGDPIAHSLSPKLHALFAAQANLRVDYRAILAPPERFAQQLNDFFTGGGVGANITLPHKARVLTLATEIQPRARLAGAANTLSVRAASPTVELIADNTDGEGLVRDLRRQFGDLSGARILVLGAGGAVRGALGPLLAADCSDIAVYNRTADKAQAVVRDLQQGLERADEGRVLRAISERDDGARFDLVINGISAGHQGEFPLALPEQWVQAAEFAYDMSYGNAAKPFHNYIEGRQSQLRVADGLGMLVEQGALSFAIWTGVTVDADEALLALRNVLGAC